VRLWLARRVAMLPGPVYRRLPAVVRLWLADVRVRGYVERGSW
jgi:hypothetical protein